jgi:hypothetical protein
MAKDVIYVRHRVPENIAFRSPNGLVGNWLTKKTGQVAAHAITHAPKPGQSRGYATGELARKIKPERTVAGRTGPESRVVSGADHSVFVHEGTAPHVIRPRRKDQLMFFMRKAGHVVFTDGVKHPGTSANKFLLKALRTVFGGPGR